jgi:hypothetical protein
MKRNELGPYESALLTISRAELLERGTRDGREMAVLERQADALERIAAALEKLAGIKPKGPGP